MLKRYYYSDSIENFLITSQNEILGELALRNNFSLEQAQRTAWVGQIKILQNVLSPYQGSIYFYFCQEKHYPYHHKQQWYPLFGITQNK